MCVRTYIRTYVTTVALTHPIKYLTFSRITKNTCVNVTECMCTYVCMDVCTYVCTYVRHDSSPVRISTQRRALVRQHSHTSSYMHLKEIHILPSTLQLFISVQHPLGRMQVEIRISKVWNVHSCISNAQQAKVECRQTHLKPSDLKRDFTCYTLYLKPVMHYSHPAHMHEREK
jgi:hypothetical protein